MFHEYTLVWFDYSAFLLSLKDCTVEFLSSINLITVPTGPPFVIMAQDITATSLKLLWSPPEERHHNGIIIKYAVCYQDSILRTNCRNITEISEGKRKYDITNLRPNTKYIFQVKAATKAGWGIPGAIYKTTLPAGKLKKILWLIYA